MKLRDLALRLRAVFAPRRVEHELNEELEFHLECETRKLVEQGLSPADARRQARARFGSPALAADECRDARGIAFVDSCVRDIAYAFRMFTRSRLASFTIITTLGLGLGLVTVVFTIANVALFRADNVPRPGELFEVRRTLTESLSGSAWAPFTRQQLETLRRETSAFRDPFAMLEDIDSRIDGRMMSGTLVTGNFFQAVGVQATMGRTLLPSDDDRSAPKAVVVLSHRGWTRQFESDPAVVGRSLLVNGFSYQIVGVMPEGFRGLALGAPDYWAPLAEVGQFRPIHVGHEDAVGISVVGRLRPGVSKSGAIAELSAWHARGGFTRERGHDREHITLLARKGTLPKPLAAMVVLTPIFFAFGLILVIACANVANLLLARSISRQREIGVRLSMGASRRRIVRQLLTENLLLALAAAVVGFIVSRALIVLTISAVTSSLAPEFAELISVAAPSADWRVALFLAAGAMGSTMFFALSPALQATRVDLVRTMRGEVTRDARPSRARHFLIGIQVMASALLLISSAVFLRGALASATFDSGVRTADTVSIDINNEKTRSRVVSAAVSDPVVTAAAATSPALLSRSRNVSAQLAGMKIWIDCRIVSPEYFDVLGLEIIRGRGFTAAERSPAAAVAIISESQARRLEPGGEIVGKIINLDPNTSINRGSEEVMFSTRAFTVVGISRDAAGFRFSGYRESGIYIPGNSGIAHTSLIVRVRGDVDVARRSLLTRLTAVDPNMGQVMTLATMAALGTYVLQILFWTTLVLGGVALALTLSGLFGVLSYLVEQRAKEFGVRIAIGATAHDISVLVFSQTFKPVGIGLIIGSVLAAGAAAVLLSTPAAAVIGGVVHVLDPVAYAGGIAVIIVTCAIAAFVPARRAARTDAISSLRQE